MGRMFLIAITSLGAAAARLVSGATRDWANGLSAGKDDRDPGGHLTRGSIGLKHGESDRRCTSPAQRPSGSPISRTGLRKPCLAAQSADPLRAMHEIHQPYPSRGRVQDP